MSNVVLQEIENKVFQQLKSELILYLQYVDDALIIVNTGTDEIEEIWTNLSNVIPFKKFTVEHEEEDKILYLDNIDKKESGQNLRRGLQKTNVCSDSHTSGLVPSKMLEISSF